MMPLLVLAGFLIALCNISSGVIWFLGHLRHTRSMRCPSKKSSSRFKLKGLPPHA